MKIGVTSLGMAGKPLTEALPLMAALGAEATELNGRPGVHPDISWGPGDTSKVKKMLRQHGITATSLGGYSDFAQLDAAGLEAQIKQLVGYAQRAADLEIPVVRAFGGDTKEGHTLADFRESIYKGFEEALRRTEGLGIVIGIENHGKLTNDGDVMRQVLNRVASPRLGVMLDTGNFAWAGHSLANVERFFDDLLSNIFSLHIKDGIWPPKGEFEFVPAGRGKMPLPRLLAGLASRQFAGGVISEYEGSADYVEGTRESVAYLRGLRDGIMLP